MDKMEENGLLFNDVVSSDQARCREGGLQLPLQRNGGFYMCCPKNDLRKPN